MIVVESHVNCVIKGWGGLSRVTVPHGSKNQACDWCSWEDKRAKHCSICTRSYSKQTQSSIQ